ncbi:hypothetical protein EYF80_015294 [Liparis tanakae]|uniref:Uncharacterized protein n=1 Tax=Liparis tanakae TaxID=230148 RepID=A0A4Z2IB19_9TELE|nr:hypothetical protein EYF80_015294 [Liparis tanakae]
MMRDRSPAAEEVWCRVSTDLVGGHDTGLLVAEFHSQLSASLRSRLYNTRDFYGVVQKAAVETENSPFLTPSVWGLSSVKAHEGCGKRALVRSLYTAQSLRSSSSFLSSMKDVTTCIDTRDNTRMMAFGHFVKLSMYSRENHRTTPRRRDVPGLSYLNPPRTSGPLF